MDYSREIYKSYQAFKALARWDRPIGIWLLYFPCIWAVALHAKDLVFLLSDMLFYLIGAILLRGAGCTLNDLLDHFYDAKVERTKNRPLPSGQLTRSQAIFFLGLQLAFGFLLFISLRFEAQALALLALFLAAFYPLVKRYSYWPQAFLGVTFNLGLLIAWLDLTGSLNQTAFFLYGGAIFWTLGYDTIYASQDMADDRKIGVKSTALLWEKNLRFFVGGCYFITSLFFILTGVSLKFTPIFYFFLILPLSHLFWQVKNWRWQGEKANSLIIFRSNATFGFLFFLFLTIFHLFNA